MPFATEIVPMPRWSTPVGCTKMAISIIVLVLTAVCCAIWGAYPAFGLSIFTASLSLVAFGYYLTALSFRPQLYNKCIVLVLESFLTLFWFISLILLAGWLGASTAFPQWTWHVPIYGATPYGANVDLTQRDLTDETFNLWSSPFDLIKRQRLKVSTTPIRVHEHKAQETSRILAGISAGLVGIAFVLYGVTLIVFSINMNKPPADTSSAILDEEAHTETVPPSRTNTNISVVQPGAAMPPAVTQPLRVNTLPKDFEPKPQRQEHYLTPAQAAEAGIEPPTPVLRAQIAEKDKTQAARDEDTEKAGAPVPEIKRASSPVSPLEQEKEE